MPELTFAGLIISYDHRVLEPRPWTEAQSSWAAELLAQAPAGPVLELCAGVGHIGLAAVQDSHRDLVMVDFNPITEHFAQHNAVVNNMAERIEFRLARMQNALAAEERFGLIIADPPWVRSTETSRFPADPVLAIDGGDDGLDLARTCVELIDQHLADGGSALLQLGSTEQVRLIAQHAKQLGEGAVTVQETKTFDDGVIVRLAR
ncbi:MAG: methyltransferase [Yaniella sp.]|uniref:methyltransferase n=1 Tax=Yaniella sp. TaxID=2773929 RepID=UPI00264716AA|nr:methyltransferase [Yaniella sp.]MDN5732582.1 methyltransferase [Yaniella sp.]MDN5742952.1 methyltransferase [Yaniella sp.]MDN5816452.1 methyltransferase [Yaniella sp.]MDN5818390.1 methyltransferase [Yaniella sp.]MDN5839291.1 methyltransferase [Yaniella sp.]